MGEVGEVGVGRGEGSVCRVTLVNKGTFFFNCSKLFYQGVSGCVFVCLFVYLCVCLCVIFVCVYVNTFTRACMSVYISICM